MNWSTLFGGLIQSSALVLVLWVILRFLPRIAPITRAWLWRLAVLKLAWSAVAIGTVTLNVLPNRVAPSGEVREVSAKANRAFVPSAAVPTEIEQPEFRVVPSPTPSVIATPADRNVHTFEPLVLGIWGAGLVLFCLLPLLDALKVRRWLQRVVPIEEDEIQIGLKNLSEGAGLSRVPRLVCSESAPSPMVYGIWRPLIILPKRIASALGEDLRLALAHEIAHIRRGDLGWAVVAWLVRSALFFNPVAWLAEKELRSAQESATDQEAIWLTGTTVCAYGEMLLRAMVPNRVAWNPSGLPMFDSFRNAQRRLTAMKNFGNPPTLTCRMLGVSLVAIATGFLPTYILAPANAASVPRGNLKNGQRSARITRKDAGVRRPAKAEPRLATVAISHPFLTPGELVKSPPKLVPSPAVLVMSVIASKTGAKSLPPAIKSSSALPQPVSKLEEVAPAADDVESLQDEDLKHAAKEAQDVFGQRVAKLIANQDERIAEYGVGADEREQGAEEREREGQQRKREGEQRARAALLREQVIEEREKDGYKIADPGQKEADWQQRSKDAHQREADQLQLRLDQRQRETDQWQREFDARSVAAMREETKSGIATARSQYKKRIRDLIADDFSRRREVTGAAAYTQSETKQMAEAASLRAGMHVVKTASGLSLAIPDGYEIANVKATGEGAYTIVLNRTRG